MRSLLLPPARERRGPEPAVKAAVAGGAFETTELEAAEHVLSNAYASIRISRQGQWGGMRLAQATLSPAVRFDRLSVTMSLTAAAGPLGALVIGEVTSGQVTYGPGGSQRSLRPGQVYLAQPGHAFAVSIQDAELELAVIDPVLPGQVAGQPVRLTGYQPVSSRVAQIWKATYAYVRDEVLARPEAAAQPLVAASAERLLAATALATFPNNALTGPGTEDHHDAHPATLRRAMAFIDEHAHEAITVADIAAAAFVTTRAVQLAFRRHLDTTPLAYLRRVRLEHAHRQLLAADPARETITAIAYRWGFPSPSRFAAHYRAAYGVSPGYTLRG